MRTTQRNGTTASAITFFIAAIVLMLAGCRVEKGSVSFQSSWPADIVRTWPGPEYWTNRLQDWRISSGRLECLYRGPNRNVHLLTHQAGEQPGSLEMSVRFGLLGDELQAARENWIGFRVGARGEFNDYRDSAIYGKGLDAGVTVRGDLFIGDSSAPVPPALQPQIRQVLREKAELVFSARPEETGYSCTLTLRAPGSDVPLQTMARRAVPADRLPGNLALVCSIAADSAKRETPAAWFADWRVSGSKVQYFPEHAFGPVLFAQYTLSDRVLKLTAQLPPLGPDDPDLMQLEIKQMNGEWERIAGSAIDKVSCTATFRVPNWRSSRRTPYRFVYGLPTGRGKIEKRYWEGTIRAEPFDRPSFVIAAFTGNNDLGFPNTDLVRAVQAHDPDMLFFSGDQIYERVGGYGVQRTPFEKARLDYLRKWYLFGWAYRDLMRERPTVTIPDDHDVYHGNIWGEAGKPTPLGLTGQLAQDAGGYKMPARWVNLVQRTQTSHLPDPYDPGPVEQGIGVYFTSLRYAGVSFAILEDRKFKSAPKMRLPAAKIVNGWPQNSRFDPKREADDPGAGLLGERQLYFLRRWVQDWRQQTWMKVVLSQTLFANVATLPASAKSDAVVPKLRILQKGEYPRNDRIVADFDSNGWPPTGRNKALREMRRGFAIHIAGDQHLGSTVQYGIDAWNDAAYAFCVPAISNIWPRRWYPPVPGKNRMPGAPKYTGEFEDGFGNKMTVHAVSNPVATGRKPAKLYDRATGYGIIRLNRRTREIVFEAWPRWVDPTAPDARPYSGWPVTFNQLDNYGKKPSGWLPLLQIRGMRNPVVQVFDEQQKELIYNLRISGREFRPMVFTPGPFTVLVGEPEIRRMQMFNKLTPHASAEAETLRVDF